MSSVGNRFITKEQAITFASNDIFIGHENDDFAMSMIDPYGPNSSDEDSLELAYKRFRTNVYIDQTRMISDDLRNSDGIETDIYDETSEHFVVCRNERNIGKAAIFACMRLIYKKSMDQKLPVEEDFIDFFRENQAPINSVETSRFIAESSMSRENLLAKDSLISAGLARVDGNGGKAYAMVEPTFERALKLMGMPVNRIAEPKFIPEYNDYNLGLEIDKIALRNKIGENALKFFKLEVGQTIYWKHRS